MYQKEKAIILIFFIIRSASIFVIKSVLIFLFFLQSVFFFLNGDLNFENAKSLRCIL